MFGKASFCLALVALSLAAASEASTLELQSIVTQLIVKESSPLCISLEYYELDQVFIIQQHVDTVSIEMYQVYVRFTVVASCKPGGPQSCEDQMRLCDAQFGLNGTDVNDDVCKCDALPDIQFERPDDEKIDVEGKIPEADKKPTGKPAQRAAPKEVDPQRSQNINSQDAKSGKTHFDDSMKDTHRAAENNKPQIQKVEKPKTQESATAKAKTGLITEDSTDEKKRQAEAEKRKESAKPATRDSKVVGDNRKDTAPVEKARSKNVGGPLNSIELLLFIQNAVDAVNDAAKGKYQMTLSRISSINLSDPKGPYSLEVVATQASGDTQKCSITAKPQPGMKEQAVLVDYVCKPLTSAVPKSPPAKDNPPAPSNNNLPAPYKPPKQITLIAEYAAIQMDIIDTDDYRRVVLQVTDVQETLTTDGNSLLYSLSVIMVTTSCTETKSLYEDSHGCLESLISPPQQCNIDCSRSCTSDEPPTLVNSQCDPLMEDSKWLN